jgi:hypothetical protein
MMAQHSVAVFCFQPIHHGVAQGIPEAILQEDPKLLMWYDQALARTGGD